MVISYRVPYTLLDISKQSDSAPARPLFAKAPRTHARAVCASNAQCFVPRRTHGISFCGQFGGPHVGLYARNSYTVLIIDFEKAEWDLR